MKKCPLCLTRLDSDNINSDSYLPCFCTSSNIVHYRLKLDNTLSTAAFMANCREDCDLHWKYEDNNIVTFTHIRKDKKGSQWIRKDSINIILLDMYSQYLSSLFKQHHGLWYEENLDKYV